MGYKVKDGKQAIHGHLAGGRGLQQRSGNRLQVLRQALKVLACLRDQTQSTCMQELERSVSSLLRHLLTKSHATGEIHPSRQRLQTLPLITDTSSLGVSSIAQGGSQQEDRNVMDMKFLLISLLGTSLFKKFKMPRKNGVGHTSAASVQGDRAPRATMGPTPLSGHLLTLLNGPTHIQQGEHVLLQCRSALTDHVQRNMLYCGWKTATEQQCCDPDARLGEWVM